MSSGERTPTPRFAFVEDALDRADALRDNPDALHAYWANARVVRVDADGRAPVDIDGSLVTVAGAALGVSHAEAVFLGMREDEAWFAQAVGPPGEGERRVDLRRAAALWSAFDATVFAQARAVLHWQSRHRFCGACGDKIGYERGGWLGRCAGCGLEHYPRTDPAVIVAVGSGDRLLLGRQASWPERWYSTLAGFVEPGETLEQTVVREVMEESGVRVRTCRYLASQPWPFPSSLMLGFVADAEPDPPQADQELEDVRWFERDEVGAALRGENRERGLLLSPSISISRWLIEYWYEFTAGAASGNN